VYLTARLVADRPQPAWNLLLKLCLSGKSDCEDYVFNSSKVYSRRANNESRDIFDFLREMPFERKIIGIIWRRQRTNLCVLNVTFQ
jgi:hypothetical protein